NLDHHVRAVQQPEQPPRLVERGRGVVLLVRRDLQADVAVAPLGALVDRPEQVGDCLDVLDRQRLEDLSGGLAGVDERVQRLVVVGAAANRFLEDGRVRGDAGDLAGVDQPRQRAAAQQATADVVVPDALTLLAQLEEGVVRHWPLSLASGFGTSRRLVSRAPAPTITVLLRASLWPKSPGGSAERHSCRRPPGGEAGNPRCCLALPLCVTPSATRSALPGRGSEVCRSSSRSGSQKG